MHSSVVLPPRLQELLRGPQVLWRSRERVEHARGGERQPIQPCGKDNVKVFGTLVMREITGGRENRDLEITFDLAETTEFLDGCHGTLLAPHEKRGLTQSAERMADIDVEMTRKKCGRRVASAALM